LSLGLQTDDLVQFFQNKIDTVDFLIQQKSSQEEKICGILHFISETELKEFCSKYKRISQRLIAVKQQIQTIRDNFEALLASQNSQKQVEQTNQLNWMTRITVAVLPLNLVAGLFGMNVPVPMQGSALPMFL
jgi:Mg2+ and Co2+ transporter CorA